MAGYSGYSMSNNAVCAYSNGEKPISKWTKVAFIEAVRDEFEECELNAVLPFVKKLTIKQIKSDYLEYAGWHHTSKFYNKTEFYAVDFDKLKKDAGCVAPEPEYLEFCGCSWPYTFYSGKIYGMRFGKFGVGVKMIRHAYVLCETSFFRIFDENKNEVGICLKSDFRYERQVA